MADFKKTIAAAKAKVADAETKAFMPGWRRSRRSYRTPHRTTS
jgi:hypothetical protein